MMLQYSPESIADLTRLREFIAEKNPIAAQRIAGELLEGIKKLEDFPQIGIPVSRAPDPDKIRDLYIGKYVVRYLVTVDAIYILRLWHTKETGRVS